MAEKRSDWQDYKVESIQLHSFEHGYVYCASALLWCRKGNHAEHHSAWSL